MLGGRYMARVEIPVYGALSDRLSDLLGVTEYEVTTEQADENWLQRTPPSAHELEELFAAIDAEEARASRRIERIFNTLRRDGPQSRPARPARPDADNDSIASAEPHCRPMLVDRVVGLSIKIWADEHPPPHFHVTYQGEDASFSIVDCTRLPGVVGLERYERKIRDWWKENKLLLVANWNSSRPANCPVGPLELPTT